MYCYKCRYKLNPTEYRYRLGSQEIQLGIGTFYQGGVEIGPSNYGMVIMNDSGSIHIYPANPTQW